MTDDALVERVAKALSDDTMRRWRSPVFMQKEPWREFIPAACAAIDAYEQATLQQDERDRRIIWEAVERMKITPPDTPLMDAIKSGSIKP